MLLQVAFAEQACAEGAFEPGMWPAIFLAAEPGAVALAHALAIGEVDGHVCLLQRARLAGAYGFVSPHEMGVVCAEITPAVLAGMGWQLLAAGEPPPKLAAGRGHRADLEPGSRGIVAGCSCRVNGRGATRRLPADRQPGASQCTTSPATRTPAPTDRRSSRRRQRCSRGRGRCHPDTAPPARAG